MESKKKFLRIESLSKENVYDFNPIQLRGSETVKEDHLNTSIIKDAFSMSNVCFYPLANVKADLEDVKIKVNKPEMDEIRMTKTRYTKMQSK